jgi:hypothetical protein
MSDLIMLWLLLSLVSLALCVFYTTVLLCYDCLDCRIPAEQASQQASQLNQQASQLNQQAGLQAYDYKGSRVLLIGNSTELHERLRQICYDKPGASNQAF